jgi:hypothetical protein
MPGQHSFYDRCSFGAVFYVMVCSGVNFLLDYLMDDMDCMDCMDCMDSVVVIFACQVCANCFVSLF